MDIYSAVETIEIITENFFNELGTAKDSLWFPDENAE